MKRWLLVVAVALSGACSHASNPTTTESASDSSGGEAAQTTQGASDQGQDASGVALGTHAPIAIPLPGVARGSLRPELQRLWADVEQALALEPPAPPMSGDENAIASWASGPFTAWILQRVRATRQAESIGATLTDLEPFERGFALALVSFAYEDMAATARGAPVPAPIANDPELLAVYAEAIDRALLPIAQYAAIGFEGCAQVFQQSGDSAWSEWPGFCATHLEDLREVFGRYARPEGGSTAP